MKLRDVCKRAFWFGNGRVFGIQVGSLEQRLQDPFYNRDVEVLSGCTEFGHFSLFLPGKHYTVDRWINDFLESKNGPKRLDRIKKILAGKINSGTADSGLIPFLDGFITEKFLRPDSMPVLIDDESMLGDGNYTYRKAVEQEKPKIGEETPKNLYYFSERFEDWISRNGSVHHLYYVLVNSAFSFESIPYLLQALNSRAAFRNREEPLRQISRIKVLERTEHHGCSTDYLDDYQVTNHYEVVLPFAELAKERLVAIRRGTDSYGKKGVIDLAIEEFDRTKPGVVEETFVESVPVG